MKRKIITILLLFSLILSTVQIVYAEDINLMSVAMSPSNKTITISGFSSQREVPIYILQRGKTIADFKNDRTMLLNMLQTQTDNSGWYSITAGYDGYTECTVCVADGETYLYKDASENSYMAAGLGNIFNLPEKFGALPGSTTKERFKSARVELPDEMPIYTPVEITGTKYIYVSPGANGNGSIDNPYGTLSEAVTEAKNKPHSTVIYLRGGQYDSEQTAALSSITASSEFPLMISAYENEEVVFTGGLNLKRSDFTEVSNKDILKRLPIHASGVVLSVNLKEMGFTSFPNVRNTRFSVDGVEYTIARYPDIGFTGMMEYTGTDGENGVIDSGSITTTSGSTCGAPREVGLKGEAGFEIQVADTRPFEWVNTDNIWVTGSFYEEWSRDTARIKEFNESTQSIRTYTGATWGAKYNEHNGFYYFNVLEEMNKPGEWFLDDTTGDLYLYPHDEFSDATFYYNSNTLLNIASCKNVVINGISFEGCPGKAINIVNCENILVQNCDFEDGNAGVSISGESKFCGVINSAFNGMSGKPISIESPDVTTDTIKKLLPQYNFIQNNYVYDSDSVLVRGNANIVSHNVITNSKGSGIYSDRGHEVIIEYNEVAYGNTEIADSGAIYVGGNRLGSGGNHVRYNYIHHCKENRSSTYGIYFDDFMSRSYIYGNIMEDTDIFLHNGSDNTVYNNIVVNLPSVAIKDSTNYLEAQSFVQRWKTGALEYGSFTEFLDPEKTDVYIDVTSDTSAYAIRYPSLKDWANKMYQRIEEYETNGVVEDSNITVSYTNGTTTDLDTYLRSPRYNYYANNVMVITNGGMLANALSVTEEGNASAEIGTNKTINLKWFGENPFTNGYNETAYETVRNSISGFESIAVDKVGITADTEIPNLKPEVVFPLDNQIVELTDIGFRWVSKPGHTINTLKISEYDDMSDPVITQLVVENEYVLTDENKALLEKGKRYYWQISAENKTSGVSNQNVNSDIYSFIVNSDSLEFPAGGILVCSIKNADGKNVEDIAKEAALTVSGFAYNKGNTSFKNVILYAACYGENGELLSVEKKSVGIIEASTFTENFIFNLTNTTGASELKIFMWDDNMQPLSEFKEIK